jgi:hypothetical protein
MLSRPATVLDRSLTSARDPQIIFYYGSLTFRLAGTAAQPPFLHTWAVSVGISQAAQLRDFALSALHAIVLLTVLDSLRLVSDACWFEQHVDQVSVQAGMGEQERKTSRTETVARHYLENYSGIA